MTARGIDPTQTYTVITSSGTVVKDIPGHRIFTKSSDGCAGYATWDAAQKLEKAAGSIRFRVYVCSVKGLAPFYHVILSDVELDAAKTAQ